MKNARGLSYDVEVQLVCHSALVSHSALLVSHSAAEASRTSECTRE